MLQTPPELVERYRSLGWWGDSVVTDYLDRWTDETPDRIALVSHFYADDRAETLSYGQVHRLVDRLAWTLLDLGVEPSDRVVVQLPNWWHFPLFYLACIRIGATIVPITPIMRSREVGHILERTAARVAVVPSSFRRFDHAAMLEGLSAELTSPPTVIVVGDPVPEGMLSFERDVLLRRREVGRSSEDLRKLRPDPIQAVSCICFTSGTTGEPKGVMHNQATMMFQTGGPRSVLGLSREDTVLMPSPLGHYTGFEYGINTPMVAGMKTVLMDYWDPNTAVRLVAEERVSWTWAATTFLMDFARSDALDEYAVPSLRYFICGGASIPGALVEEVHRRLSCRVIPDWGMTELGGVTFVWPDDPPSRAAGTDGGPIPGMEVSVVDPVTREPVPVGTDGILRARGPSRFVGYYLRPDLWDLANDDDHWFDTGDLARMDEQGYIRIVGRTKDIVIRGGENIPVAEVEDVLFRHPKVSEVAVVGTADPRLGERACACVVLGPGERLTFEELQQWFDESQTAKQYWPERLEVFDEFPKTPAGKIQKFVLRELVEARKT
ncbi:MAG: AMP-binding protein [Chloroflexi bacterium]|nr:AMP-binding protein [Chloroflexota bacterium]